MIAALFSLGKRRISRGGLVAERLNKDSDCVDGGDSSLCLSADLIGRGGRGLGRAELRQVPLLASNRVKQLLFLSTGLLHFFLSFFSFAASHGNIHCCSRRSVCVLAMLVRVRTSEYMYRNLGARLRRHEPLQKTEV